MTKKIVRKPKRKRAEREYRGLRPPDEEIAKMHEEGYALPITLRAELGLSNGFVYNLQNRLQPIEGDDRPVVRRSARGNVWLLRAAVDAFLAARTGEPKP